MKRVLSILILCVFLAHFAGFYVYFFVQLTQVRKEMKAILKQLPAERLELIKLSSVDFKKARVEEHEIKVNGKMYDIARIEKAGENYLVYCIHDKTEDDLLAFLDKVVSLPLKDKNVPPLIFKFISLTFILPSTQTVLPFTNIHIPAFTEYKKSVPAFVPVVDSPPPQM